MQTLIVPNGGRDGAILTSSRGATTASISDPVLLNALRATSRLTAAMASASNQAMHDKLAKMAIGASHLTVELVEAAFGPMDNFQAVVFQDDGDGFTCGSTGKPPIPLPWPANRIKSPLDLAKSGAVAPDVVELIRLAKVQGKDLTLLLDDPHKLAKELGVGLSGKSLEDLAQLSPRNVEKAGDAVDKEVVALFRAVLKDGRFTSDWYERPYDVANQLNVRISEAALERVVGVSGQVGIGGQLEASAICAGVVWAGVCIAIGTLFVGQMNPLETLVEDRSGKAKF